MPRATAAPPHVTAGTSQSPSTEMQRIHGLVGQLDSSHAGAAIRQLLALPPTDLMLLSRELAEKGLSPSSHTALATAITRVQQRAVTKARRRRRYRWYVAQTLHAYRRIGDHNPKWDMSAQKALLLFSKQEATPAFDLRNAFVSYGLDRERIRAVYEALMAMRKGCRDPLINLIADRSPFWKKRHRLWPIHRNIQADIHALLVSQYPAPIKLEFITAMAIRCAAESNWRTAAAYAREDLGLMPEVVRHPGVPISVLTSEIGANFQCLAGPSGGPLSWHLASTEILSAIKAKDRSHHLQYVYLYLKGFSLVQWAWRARRNGYAHQVTPTGARLFTQRLTAARTALREAYQLSPRQPEAPLEMMTVNLGLGHPKQIVTWFKRTMKADPDNYMACDSMLWALHRRWYGSAASMYAFGKWCVRYGHWKSRIPFLALHALFTLEANRRYPKLWGSPNIAYIVIGHGFWRNPRVWKTLHLVFDEYYHRCPKSVYHLGLYIFLCMWADKWKNVLDRLAWYHHTPRNPQVDKVVEKFYFGYIPEPGYYPLAVYEGQNAVPWYFSLTNYSLDEIYREAKIRIAHTQTTLSWAERSEIRHARYVKWAAHITIRVKKNALGTAPQWAHAFGQAMREERHLLVQPGDDRGNQRDLMVQAAKTAIALGCRSPLLLYFEARNAMAITGPDAIGRKAEIAAARELLAGRFPLADQFMAALTAARAAEALQSRKDAGTAAAMIVAATRLLPKFVGDKNIPIAFRVAECRKLWMADAANGKTLVRANTALEPLLAEGHTPPILVALVEAWQAEKVAVDLLGGSGLNAVRRLSPGKARTFLADLHKSLAMYHMAWLMNPDCTIATNGALTAQLWINVRTKQPWAIWPFYSNWFIRAFNANPHNIGAFCTAIRFEAMCADPFDGEHYCVDDQYIYQVLHNAMFFRPPSSRMALAMLYGAQIVLNNPVTNKATHQLRPVTLLQGLRVWKHLQPIMTAYFTIHPQDEKARSYYARLACETHHWNTAEAQFRALGSHVRIPVFGGRKIYRRLKAEAARITMQ